MAFIFNGFGQATLEFTTLGPGGNAMVTFGFSENGLNPPDLLAQNCRVAWTDTDSMHRLIDTEATLLETRVLIRRGGQLLAGIDTVSVPGQSSSVAGSPQVAALFQKQTGFAGRNRRGRMYVPNVLSPGQTGVYTPAHVTVSQGLADTFMQNLVSVGTPMYLLHTDPVDPPNEVNELVAQATVATQRRRMR